MSNIKTNVEHVRQKVAAAAQRAGRNPADVTIIAVSKLHTVAEIEEALAAGITHLGENRVQELQTKWPALGGRATWHLIGSLQTNKVKPALQMSDLIHSVDRPSLVQELAKQAQSAGKPCDVLVQVNVSGEMSKHGVSPQDLPALITLASQSHLRIRGLMTMAPLDADPEAARPYFRRLRELADELRSQARPNVTLEHLSMGMSGDYEVAIEEGATLVRIGTAIFGSRTANV